MSQPDTSPESRTSIDRRKTVTLPEFVLSEFEELSRDLGGEPVPALVVRACESWLTSESYQSLKALAQARKKALEAGD